MPLNSFATKDAQSELRLLSISVPTNKARPQAKALHDQASAFPNAIRFLLKFISCPFVIFVVCISMFPSFSFILLPSPSLPPPLAMGKRSTEGH
jgi:hypothetical protein